MKRGRTTSGLEKPKLERMRLLKAVLQGYRSRLDEELQPLGITTAQLRVLVAVAENPTASGAKVARLCSVTPQTGQTLLMKLEAEGWITRRSSLESERVLLAKLTASGRRVFVQAGRVAEKLDRCLWAGLPDRNLSVLDAALAKAQRVLERERGEQGS